jgi:hypothetical protein
MFPNMHTNMHTPRMWRTSQTPKMAQLKEEVPTGA